MEEIIRIFSDMEIKDFKERRVLFPDNRLCSLEIKKENFHQEEKISDKKIVFIDGGNSEILKSSNFSLSVCRVAYVIFKNNKRIDEGKVEFYCLVKSIVKGDEIYYQSDLIFLNGNLGLKKEDLEFSSYDKSIRQGNFIVDISEIARIARRFAEIKMIEKIIGLLSEGDIIIKDGILIPYITNESRLYEEIISLLKQKKIVLASVAKTSNLITNKGESLNYFLSRFADENLKGAWWYWPICKAEGLGIDIYFAKLHNKSEYVFRIDIINTIPYDFKEIFWLLKKNSVDSAFLGYPYGLIYADKIARVSDDEKQYYRTKLISASKGLWKDINRMIKDNDAHEKLDNI